jgi:vacuolar-type H+-ATPase subunit I/STV1
MTNALDAFREQRVAAGQVYAVVRETTVLISELQTQVKALSGMDELKALLQQEERWLRETERVVAEVRRLRDEEVRRLRPALVRRWALALIFAVVSAAAAGAGYAWVSRPYEAELAALRSRMEFAEFVEHRALAMTPAERRQLDALMRWNSPSSKH